MKRICTILARGGSKGLPGKNMRPLAGRPLIVHSIEQARSAGIFDAIAFSSDHDDLLTIARDNGVEHVMRRPDDMAADTASKLPPIRHAVEAVEGQTGDQFDIVVDIDVTAPLRAPEDIRGAVELLESNDTSCVITAAPARKSAYFNQVERNAEGYAGLVKPLGARLDRRQDSPQTFDMNAAVYVWRREAFMTNPDIFYPDTLLYEMPEERSHDIDSALDFEFVEFLMSRKATS